MDKTEMTALLHEVAAGNISPEDAALKLKMQPFQEIGEYAKVDFHRGIRQGVPEVIYGAGKTKEHILGIAQAMVKNGQQTVLITRLTPEAAAFVSAELPLKYDELSKTGVIGELPKPTGKGRVVVATGGTSDIPVAEEAAVTAEVLGNEVVRLYDVGVSGIHRLTQPHGHHHVRPRHCRGGGHGGGAALGHRRACRLPGHCGSHKRRLRGQPRRHRGAAEYAQLLRKRRVGGEHRQRLRRGLYGEYDKPS